MKFSSLFKNANLKKKLSLIILGCFILNNVLLFNTSAHTNAADYVTPKVAFGASHTLALLPDGSVYGWGRNNVYQLGDTTSIDRPNPVKINGISSIVQISSVFNHSLALDANGDVWAWGENYDGRAGTGKLQNVIQPTKLTGISGVKKVCTGMYFSLALKSNGDVYAWGANSNGQLGDNTTVGKTSPIKVSSLSNIQDIAAGDAFALAKDASGNLWAWGQNSNGQFGNGTTTGSLVPVKITSITNIDSIFANVSSSAAILEDGSVKVWGRNSAGQLSDGTTTQRTLPQTLAGFANIKDIVFSANNFIVLKDDNTIAVAGNNTFGQVGDNTTDNRLSLTTVSGLTDIVSVCTGYSNASAAIKSDGSIYIWGNNASYQLGNGTVGIKTVPAKVDGVSAIKASGGTNFSLLVKPDKTLLSFGNNKSGQLGDGTYVDKYNAVTVSGLSNIKDVSAGQYHSMALTEDGFVYTWGGNNVGVLGDGLTSTTRSVPYKINTLSDIAKVSAGVSFSSALKSNGTIFTWGYNGYGQLGDNTTISKSTPVQVPGLNDITSIANGSNHALALDSAGKVWTWGYNAQGQIGDNTTANRRTPYNVLNDVSQIAAGTYHSVALKNDGTVWTWGFNGYGQLGDNTLTNRLKPVMVPGLTGISQIYANGNYVIACKSDGKVYMWGQNTNGEQANGKIADIRVPAVNSKLNSFDSFGTGANHLLQVNTLNEVFTWGGNFSGETHSVDKLVNPHPVKLPALSNNPPEIVLQNNGSEQWSNGVSTKVLVNNTGGGIDSNSLQYVWSTTQNIPASGWLNFANGDVVSNNTIIGDCYLFVKASSERGATTVITSSRFRNGNVPFIPTVGQHPRIYVKASDIAALKAKYESPQMSYAKANLIAAASKINNTAELMSMHYDYVSGCIKANAFLYLVNNDTAAGRKALDFLKFYCENANLDTLYYQSVRDLLYIGGITYDWCYDLETPSERLALIADFKNVASHLERLTYPLPDYLPLVNGHYSELVNELAFAGIAVSDEDQDIYQYAMSHLVRDYIPVRNYLYNAGMPFQGSSYSVTRTEGELKLATELDVLGHPELFNENQLTIANGFIYNRLPDGKFLRLGDDFLSTYTSYGSFENALRPLMMLGNRSNNADEKAIIKAAADKHYEKGITGGPVEDLLFRDVTTTAKPLSTLPLSKYFGSPSGLMIARTGWSDSTFAYDSLNKSYNIAANSNDVIAQMKIGEITSNNHNHLDAGSFQIYYKGELAIDSGIYEGTTGGWGSSHDANYNKRTVAHNSMLVKDPNEKFTFGATIVSNDGGQRIPEYYYEPRSLNHLQTKEFKTGTVLSKQIGPDPLLPDFTYIKGDITEAYSSKVQNYTRSFVFLNFKNSLHPAAMIVFDRVTSPNSTFKKSWLLHSIEQPMVNGNITTIRRTEKGYNGKLVNHTLLPQSNNMNIDVIGGAGREFEVNGVNYPNSVLRPNSNQEPGAWRIEVSPETEANTDTFLNVMQVMDNDDSISVLNPVKIDSTDMVGCEINNNVVMFSKSGNLINRTVSFDIYGENQDIEYIITDMASGNWAVINNGVYNGIVSSTAEGNTLSFGAKSGAVELIYMGN